MIKFFGLDRQYESIKDDILYTTNEVLRTGQVLDGPNTKKFELAIAHRCHRTYAVSVNSGTQALIFAQQFYNYKRNQELNVVIPAISFIATLNSLLLVGNRPHFCDVDARGNLDLCNLDYNLSEQQIDLVMYVNLFGHPIDYNKFTTQISFFNTNSIPVIEDAAQSFGAKYRGIPSGKLGTISCLSFDPTKNLPSYGSGGMILTDDIDCYEFLLDAKNNGKYTNHTLPGTNSKMSELDCAHMLVKLDCFDNWQRRRKQIAEYYTKELSSVVVTPTVEDNVEHAWHKYVIKSPNRNKLQIHLQANGIETKIHYPSTLLEHNLNLWTNFPFIQLFNSAYLFTRQCLSLPIYPELTDSEVEKIVETIKTYNF
jgi:dTDP-4-amino-4,6-dideoxygalactose transaminase